MPVYLPPYQISVLISVASKVSANISAQIYNCTNKSVLIEVTDSNERNTQLKW